MMGLYRKQKQRQAAVWLALALIWLAFALMVSSARQKSATVDEQSHLFRGAAFLKTGATHFLLGHPLGASSLAALPLLTEPELTLPLDTPAWQNGDWSVAGDLFFWQLNANPLRLIFLGRLPVIWLTLLLGALVFRWGRQLAGPLAGLLALALLLLDPNVLAHGRFVTGDLPLTLFFTLTIYGYWRWGRTDRAGALLLTGVGLGLAGAAKFNAALLLPTLGLLALWLSWRRRAWRPIVALLPIGVTAWVVLWLANGLAWRPLPGGPFWDDLFWMLGYFGKAHGAYLLGETSVTGWWYYFPVAYLLKTPLPTLFLLLLAGVVVLRGWRPRAGVGDTAVFLLLPPALYFLVSLTSSLNIGYRHLLPMLPFLYLATAVALWRGGRRGIRVTAVAGATAVVLLSLWQWPHYVPYFNRLAGGPANSWRLLSDSNIDWGQDLPALAAWQQEAGTPLYLSYFGMAHPSAYGLTFTPLPTWGPGPEQGNPAQQAYNPANPAPGVYAISVTNLHGVVLGAQRDAFAWFREREPVARPGGSIFLYEVAANGPPVAVAFSGVRPGELAPELAAQWKSNDVRPRWFAAGSSLIWPEDGGWLATAGNGERPSLPELAALWPEGPALVAGQQAVYRLPPPPPLPWATEERRMGDTAVFLGAQLVGGTDEIVLLTGWRVVAATERPWQIFVHALDAQGDIVAQWDGLDVAPSTWQPGDQFVQMHRFAVPETAVVAQLAIGLYDAANGERAGEAVFIAGEQAMP